MAKRIIVCLDVKDNRVTKGVNFRNHKDVGGIEELAQKYSEQGADELVLYDITASSDDRVVTKEWVKKVSSVCNIPFCVAGGIRSIKDAEAILSNGADKISINSPALERPEFITELAKEFGSQAVVVGIDSFIPKTETEAIVKMYTGVVEKTLDAGKSTITWAQQAASLGAGEIVLNCMNQDGVRKGFEIDTLQKISEVVNIPVIASGGAGSAEHFIDVFKTTKVSGALGASMFHIHQKDIQELKQEIKSAGINIRFNCK